MNYLYLKAKYSHKLQWSYQIYIYNKIYGKKDTYETKSVGNIRASSGRSYEPELSCRIPNSNLIVIFCVKLQINFFFF